MYIPEKRKNRQITLFDFNQSCGMELNPNNEWIKLAHATPWSGMETKYVAMFPSKTGRPSKDKKSSKEEYQDNTDRIEVRRNDIHEKN